ncbi:MAG: hypothetical protein ABFC63_03695 [Thermoguttaceae bacterium]
MQQAEQAIVAPGRSDSTGYRIVASSPGVCEADARELIAWCPSHDSLLDSNSDSLNFHPLPSGAYCLSRTVALGCHGGREQVKTHCLIVPREMLTRFGNHPFLLARAAEGAWRSDHGSSQQLTPVTVPGGAAAVDQPLLESLARDPGPRKMASLVQSACQSICLAVAGRQPSASLLAGLLSCLPQECRLEFSFSTGLKFSPRRAFRLVALSDDPAQRCWVAQYANVAVLDLCDAERSETFPLDAWAQFVQRSLATDNLPLLAAELSKRRFQLTLDDLPALGLQLLESLDASELQPLALLDQEAATDLTPERTGHAAHERFLGKGRRIGERSQTLSASATLSTNSPEFDSPEALERLEQLDDLVYDAINGQPGAIEQLQTVWPKLGEELGEASLAESREQYLRYALSVWDQCAQGDGLRHPNQAIQALDVLCLLFGDAL